MVLIAFGFGVALGDTTASQPPCICSQEIVLSTLEDINDRLDRIESKTNHHDLVTLERLEMIDRDMLPECRR